MVPKEEDHQLGCRDGGGGGRGGSGRVCIAVSLEFLLQKQCLQNHPREGNLSPVALAVRFS